MASEAKWTEECTAWVSAGRVDKVEIGGFYATKDGCNPGLSNAYFAYKADADRAVACWNACLSIPNPTEAIPALLRLARLFEDSAVEAVSADRDIDAFRQRWEIPDGATVAGWMLGQIDAALAIAAPKEAPRV